MDAAWVGIIGVALGGGLASATGIATSVISARVVREQIKAQNDQAAWQRRSESIRGRREPRTRAYSEFLAASQELQAALLDERDMPWEQLRPQIIALNKLRTAVVVAGPDAVGMAAVGVLRAFVDNYRPRHDDPQAPASPVRGVIKAIERFIEAARHALEDHGDHLGQR